MTVDLNNKLVRGQAIQQEKSIFNAEEFECISRTHSREAPGDSFA